MPTATACSAASSASPIALAAAYGVDLRELLAARTLEEQRDFFETTLAPLFDKPAVRWATANRLSLFGLGIPPAQYEALAGGGDMRECCASGSNGSPAASASPTTISPGRRSAAPMPRRRRARCRPTCGASISTPCARAADRVEVLNRSFTEYLAGCADGSLDRYVLLDAQDWMTDAQLNALWREITRTARPGARVIFRTAARADAAARARRRRVLAAGATRPRQSRGSPRATARRSMAASISTCFGG